MIVDDHHLKDCNFQKVWDKVLLLFNTPTSNKEFTDTLTEEVKDIYKYEVEQESDGSFDAYKDYIREALTDIPEGKTVTKIDALDRLRDVMYMDNPDYTRDFVFRVVDAIALGVYEGDDLKYLHRDYFMMVRCSYILMILICVALYENH